MAIGSLFLVVSLLPWYGVLSLPSGPPIAHHQNLCVTMSPEGDHLPRNVTGPAPYTISINGTSCSSGISLQVTLEANEGFAFKGFFVQARRADDSRMTDALGTFSNIPQGSKLLKCTSDGGAWAHSTAIEKTRVIAMWAPPAENVGSIVFQATVVKGPETAFWEQIRSQPMSCDATKSCPGLYVTLAVAFFTLKLTLWRQ